MKTILESIEAKGLNTVIQYMDSDPDKNIPKVVEWVEKFDREGTSKLKSTVEDELGDVLDRFDALTSDDCTYTTFSGKDSGMEGNVKFVIETEAIE